MSRRTARAAAVALASLALVVTLSGCKPEPVLPTATPLDPSPSATTLPAPTPTVAPTPPTPPAADIALPASCEDVFSADMRATMEASGLPLNDPGLTMLSTELVDGLEIMDTAPTLRCTWGYPSEVGIATNVTLVSPEETGRLVAAYQGRGLVCEERAGGETRCEARSTSTSELGEMSFGEIEVFRGNAWITTRWLNADVPDYADDIVQTLWG